MRQRNVQNKFKDINSIVFSNSFEIIDCNIVMDLACLKLKFNPSIKKKYQNSKFCLEIMPEITCIDNLQHFDWDEQNNSLEYKIPIVYKIVISKHDTGVREQVTSDLKVYHSCIDLLSTSSSVINSNLASGDVGRLNTISDHIIYEKLKELPELPEEVPFKVEKNKDDVKEINDRAKNTNIDGTNSQVTLKASFSIVEPTFRKYSQQFTKKIDEAIQRDLNYNCLEKIDSNNQTGNSFALKEINDMLAKNNQDYLALNETYAFKIYSDIKLLSVSPICSVNTNDAIVSPSKYCKDPHINSTISCIMEYNNEIGTLTFLNSLCNIVKNDNFKSFNSNQLQRTLKCNEKTIAVRNKNIKGRNKGAFTQIRVAQFVQDMETELLPLKIMFEEIRSKCAILGIRLSNENIPNNKNIQSNDVVDSSNNNTNTPKRNFVQKINSNRVVYSIVFDG